MYSIVIARSLRRPFVNHLKFTNRRVFSLSSIHLQQDLQQNTKRERLADIKDNIYTIPNALCLAR